MQNTQKLSGDWTQVLARVEVSLTRAVAGLHEREHELARLAPAPLIPQSLSFARLEERLSAFSACPRQADQQFGLLDSNLREGEDALRHWLSRAESTRRQLAAWVGRAVI